MRVHAMRKFLIAATALAAIAAASPASAAAILVATTSAHAPNPLGGGDVSDEDHVERRIFPSSGPSRDVRASSEASGFGALSVAEASTELGINRAFARASSPATAGVDPRFPPVAGASAVSQWSDELTIGTVAPGGFVSFEFQFHAFTPQSSYDSPAGVLEYIVQFIQLFPFNQIELYRLTMDGNGNTYSNVPRFIGDGFELAGDNPGDVTRLVGVTIPFVAHQTFGISSRLACGARAPYDASNTQFCNAGGTSLWGGITGVTDADGNALTDWTVRSASGFDYTQSLIPPAVAVPEPSTWAMLILGFGAVGSLIRRRRALAA